MLKMEWISWGAQTTWVWWILAGEFHHCNDTQLTALTLLLTCTLHLGKDKIWNKMESRKFCDWTAGQTSRLWFVAINSAILFQISRSRWLQLSMRRGPAAVKCEPAEMRACSWVPVNSVNSSQPQIVWRVDCSVKQSCDKLTILCHGSLFLRWSHWWISNF